jgi:alcohol dehydrogenase
MTSFDFQCPTRIVFGPGKVAELGTIAATIGGKQVLVVSDPGIIAAGHTARGIESLKNAGFSTTLFDGVQENPTTTNVDAGLRVAHDLRPDMMIGIGGGSSMDCAKGINFLYSCGGRMHDYWGEGKATGPMLPMIAVPTTSGTGSETQSYALISDAETHIKMACGDKRAAFRAAVLDPELTITQPARVTALTGIDAISHAIESFVTRRRNTMSVAFSREAWRHLAPNFSRVLESPHDLAARAQMQLGACFAGLAIENSMLGVAHSLANPLTATFGTPHGDAIAVMLPHVIRFNGRQVGAWYLELARCVDGFDSTLTAETAPAALADWVSNVAREAGLAGKLTDCGVTAEKIPALAAAASKQWTAKFNPVEVTVADFQRLYESAL